jgi:hypothetical protein
MLVPIEHQNRHRSVRPGARHLSDDWRRRNNAGALRFGLYWIPYVDEKTTPTQRLTRPWDEAGRVEVASVTCPQTAAGSRRAKLFALLASEMGANPGHWIADRAPDASDAGVPATEFMAGRFLAYRASQQGRSALPEPSYSAVFETGEIETDLAAELVARHRANRAAGHPGPEIDDLD